MIQRLLVILLLLITPFYNVKSQKAVHSGPNFLEQNFHNFEHIVERGQTVYSIATMYNVAIDDIYRLNPGSEDVIKEGDTLKIPQESGSYFYHTIQPKETLYSVSKLYKMKGEDIIAVNPGLSVETFMIGKIIRIPTNKVTAPIEGGDEYYNRIITNNLLVPDKEGDQLRTINVALLLPFGLKEGTTPQNAASNRYVEYYEGFLLAIQEMKKKGANINLQVYDTGSGVDLIPSILKKEKMKKVHLLIGGRNEEQIKLLSNFSNANKIPYVIPFTPKSDEPLNNYYSYQVNTPQSYQYSKTSQAFCKKNKNANIIFYTPKANGNKMDFVETLKLDLDAKKIPYQVITNNHTLSFSLDDIKRNVFVTGDDSVETLSQLITPLSRIKESNSSYEISLFGHPGWQVHSNEFSESFFNLNVCFYSVFYANPTSASVKDFYKKFNRWYSRELINWFPKFGILAYDTGMYFLQLLNKYGTSYDANINKLSYQGIQTDFYFERINNWGGFINTNIYLVEFTSDSRIISERIK